MHIIFTEGTETHASLCAVIAERQYVCDMTLTSRRGAGDKVRVIVVGADDDGLETRPYPVPYDVPDGGTTHHEYGDIETLEIL